MLVSMFEGLPTRGPCFWEPSVVTLAYNRFLKQCRLTEVRKQVAKDLSALLCPTFKQVGLGQSLGITGPLPEIKLQPRHMFLVCLTQVAAPHNCMSCDVWWLEWCRCSAGMGTVLSHLYLEDVLAPSLAPERWNTHDQASKNPPGLQLAARAVWN